MGKPFFLWAFLIAVGVTVAVLMLPRGDDHSDSPNGIGAVADGWNESDTESSKPKRKDITEDDLPKVSETGPWPVVEADEAPFAFGRMQVGAENEHEFVIRNTGDGPLVLKAGDPTCKCTKFALGTTEVPPGGETTLTMRWEAKVRDPTFRHGGPVFTNDPKRQILNFHVVGAVDMPIEVAPEVWEVGNMQGDKPGVMQAVIGSRLFADFRILAIEPTSPFVTTTIEPLSSGDIGREAWEIGYKITVSVSPEIPAGVFVDKLTIRIDKLDEPFYVGLRARRHGFIRMQPMAGAMLDVDKLVLRLGDFPVSAGRTADIMLIVDETDTSAPLQITNIEADPTWATATMEPVSERIASIRRYKLTVTIPPARPRTTRSSSEPGTLRISTNHPSGESINLQLTMHSF